MQKNVDMPIDSYDTAALCATFEKYFINSKTTWKACWTDNSSGRNRRCYGENRHT